MCYKPKIYIIIIICATFFCSGTVLAVRSIPIASNSCKYTIQIPDGWDTIPQAVLKEKLPFDVDLGIYPVTQGEYFSGNYAIFLFIPTLKSLTAFPFSQIISEMANQNQQSEIKNDTLSVRLIKTDSETKDGKYSIYNYYKIGHQLDSLENCQQLRLTKFGYISVLSYAKEVQGAMPIEEISTVLSGSVSVHPDYIYSEPQKKGLTLKHILISFAIGMLAYVLIVGASKLKKKR